MGLYTVDILYIALAPYFLQCTGIEVLGMLGAIYCRYTVCSSGSGPIFLTVYRYRGLRYAWGYTVDILYIALAQAPYFLQCIGIEVLGMLGAIYCRYTVYSFGPIFLTVYRYRGPRYAWGYIL